jgi:hypothetical protein
MRRLLCTTRPVAAHQLDDYLGAWSDVRRAAQRGACRTWLFRERGRNRFLEFMEWQHGDGAPLRAERQALDAAFGAGESSEWEEVAPE